MAVKKTTAEKAVEAVAVDQKVEPVKTSAITIGDPTESGGNYFVDLYAVDGSEHIKKKNGLSYVAWANAWAELKKRHPMAYYTIYENDDGLLYHTDGRTAWVKTGVTVPAIQPLEHIEYLPVMDFRNKSIPLEKLTSMDVNTAVQRSLTKAVARHGIGLYVYAGEDLPEAPPEPEKPKELTPLEKEIEKLHQEVLKKTKGMTTKEKTDWARKEISPIAGSVNYKIMTDIDEVKKLIEHIKAHKPAA